MRAFYPSPKADFATWLRPKGPILKGDAEAMEELFARRAPTPTITRPVEVATIAAPLMRSSPSAPLLLSAASPGVPGPGFHFAQAPREINPSQQVFGFETPFPFRAPTPPQAASSYVAPQQTMIAHMPGPCRQRSAPVLLGAQQAQLQTPTSPGTVLQSKEPPMRQVAPDRGTHGHGAQPIHSPTPRPHQATSLRPDVEGAKLRPPHAGVMMPPYAMPPEGTTGTTVQIPCRQQSAPVIVHPQVTVVTTTRCPEGPWMQTEEVKEVKQVKEAACEPPGGLGQQGSKQKVPPAKAAQRLHSPPATSSRRREATIKTEAAVDTVARRHRRRILMASCMAAWAAQWRASTRAKMMASLQNCRKLQDEVTQKTAMAKQAEVELMRRTEDEFKRLREVQIELLQLQQEAPALQAVNKVSSVPFGAPRVAKLCFCAWRREARSRQRIFKLLHPSRAAQERTLLHRCWAVWQPQRLQRRCQAAVSKLAAATLDREATAFLRQILLAWHGQKVSCKSAPKGPDICTMGTAPLSAALTYQSAVIRDRPDQASSPASTRPLNMLPKEATNDMREGDATPPPPPPPARRNSVGGGASETKSDFVPITAAERLQEAAKMVEIPSPVLPAARPGGVQWRAAVWPMPAESGHQPFIAQRPGGEKMMLRLGQTKYCGAN